MMTPKAKDAAEILKKQGVSVNHLHMPTIKPLDEEAIIRVAEQTRAIVTAENGTIVGGMGDGIAAIDLEVPAVRDICPRSRSAACG